MTSSPAKGDGEASAQYRNVVQYQRQKSGNLPVVPSLPRIMSRESSQADLRSEILNSSELAAAAPVMIRVDPVVSYQPPDDLMRTFQDLALQTSQMTNKPASSAKIGFPDEDKKGNYYKPPAKVVACVPTPQQSRGVLQYVPPDGGSYDLRAP